MEDFDNMINRINHQIIACVRHAENEAVIKAIRQYARETDNVTLVEMPEDRLLKILELGIRELKKLEDDIAKSSCDHLNDDAIYVSTDVYERIEDNPKGVIFEAQGKTPILWKGRVKKKDDN